ncbi:MAG: D-alanyl-D-alanine carboxypeptidase [Firmicutes bacterium]|nr:D-alanyl-D-alanine carboxypeptidase [Bacillota bacterium]
MAKFKKAIVPLIAVLLLIVLAVGIAARVGAHAQETKEKQPETLSVTAKSALLMDYHTGTVIYEHNPAQHLPIASMVKIMTLIVIFEEIEKGNLALDTDISVSMNAYGMGGSQAFLDHSTVYKAGELIKTIVVASANDACVALAEHIAGSTEEFVVRMNEKAASLGLADTNFANCTGLPAPGAYSCARDVAVMTRELIRHKDFFLYSKIWMFDLTHPGGRITELSNTNKLIRAYEGCDGGKTGFTNEAMYCLSATARRGNTRLISVIMGSPDSKERNGENAKLFNYGFANYETRSLIVKGETQTDPVQVQNGKEEFVSIQPENDLYYFGKRGKQEFEYESTAAKLKAPVQAGQKAGELIVRLNGEELGRVNLITEKSIARKSYLDIINDMTSAW